jgi:hypothetical protein
MSAPNPDGYRDAMTKRYEILEARLAAVERLRWRWARDRRDNANQFACELHEALRLHGEDA